MLRALTYHWRMSLAVAAGAAVATAVLAGALLVGDSVRGSLRDLTRERLGAIDHALAGQRFFREEAAQELLADPEVATRFSAAAPAILLQGGAQHAETRTRASQVALQGVDERFLLFFEDDRAALTELFDQATAEPGVFPPAVINQALADALGAAAGDDLLLSLKQWSEVPRGSILGRKDTSSVVETLRLRVAGVIPDRGVGRFGLAAHQSSPFNVFVPLQALQKALDLPGKVNGLVVAAADREAAEDEAAGTAGARELDRRLRAVLTPEDLGVAIAERGTHVAIESRQYILKPALSAAVEELASEVGASTLPLLTYLVNRFELGDRRVPYSTVTALDTALPPAFGRLQLADGGAPAPPLAEGEILLNGWTAEELQAAPGDTVALTYFVVGPREELREETTSFRVAGVVEIAGLAADPELAQEYPGIAGSDSMAEWDPPFPIDLGAIRTADEEYWDEHRGTPKAFVSLADGRRLWRNRWGDLTAVRVAPGPGHDLESLARRFNEDLVAKVPLDAFGLAFRPVKALGLRSSGGATDFGGLFLGFSFFLIASAALLVALLFSLGVEQRSAEIGLLQAVGYPAARVRRRLLAEGAVLAGAGALVGLAGAVAYAALMMAGLRSWWLPAVGTSQLTLHVTPLSLVIGWAASVAVVLLAIAWRVRRLRKVPTPALLARVSEVADVGTSRRARWTAVIGLGVAAALILFAAAAGRVEDPVIFGVAGPALLVGLLALFSLLLGDRRGTGGLGSPGGSALLRMAAVNGGRNRGRSVLSATLVACASFMIVTVASFQSDFSRSELGESSGTGGFALLGEADVPLLYDLDDPDGRFELGVGGEAEQALAGAQVVSMRLLPGDDTSCLNLYQPGEPRLLGVPGELIARGGFTFQQTIEEVANPWTLLERDLGPGVVPAIGDFNSTEWILKLKLGDDLVLTDEAGETVRLRLVGTLQTSVFQSELLISEERFLRHFPSRSGWSYFLIDTPPASAEEVSRALEGALEPYGFDAVRSAEKLEAFHAVQNTYLSTFRTLGGLGLLLGTVGLAIVLLRNVIERRSELATLRAFGFRRQTLTWMVVVENALLLLAGLVIGTVAALVTAGPHLATAAAGAPWPAIAGTLAGIFFFGLAACSAAAEAAVRIPLLPALKAEH